MYPSVARSASLAAALATLLGGCGDSTEPNPEVRVSAITPTSLAGTVGAAVQPAPTVLVTDEKSQPLAGVTVTFKVVSGGGTLSGGYATTGVDGQAAPSTWTLGPTPGAQTLSASAGSEADVVFTVLAAAGDVAHITTSAGNDQLAGIGQGLAQPLVALATDAFGNPVAGTPVVFTVTSGGGTIDGAAVVTDSNGKATAGVWTLGYEEGVQQVAAVADGSMGVFRAFAAAPPGQLKGQIAFISWAGFFLEFALINADGSGYVGLPTPGLAYWLQWSPDGSHIAFVSGDPEAEDYNSRLGLMTADGGEMSWLTTGPDIWAAWYPDGTSLTVPDGNGLASISVSDGTRTPIIGVTGGNHSWSPDGRRLAIVNVGETSGVTDIYLANADGSGLVRLTDGYTGPSRPVETFSNPTWAPDGSMIALVHGVVIEGQSTERQLAVMAADGAFIKDLASTGVYHSTERPASIAWSPDGRGIAYSFVGDPAGVGGGSSGRSIKYVSLDGSLRATLVSDAQSPSWRR